MRLISVPAVPGGICSEIQRLRPLFAEESVAEYSDHTHFMQRNLLQNIAITPASRRVRACELNVGRHV